MAISILSDITTALDDQTLERLAKKFETPALQVRYGIDLAARHILENLVKHSESLEGAQDVYRKIGEFDGSILQAIRGDAEFNGTVDRGTNSLTALVGTDVKELIDVVQTSSDTTDESASHVVGLASALTLDVLGKHKKTLDLNRNSLTEMLRAQTGDTGEPPMRISDSQHLSQTNPLESTLTPDSESGTQPADQVEEFTPTPAPDAEALESPETSVPKKRRSIRPQKILKAKKTTPVDFANGEEQSQLSTPMRVLMLVAPIFVIVGTTACALWVIDQKSSAIAQLLTAASTSSSTSRVEAVEAVVPPTEATHETPPAIATTPETPATIETTPAVPSAIATTKNSPAEEIPTQEVSLTATQPVSLGSTPPKLRLKPFERCEMGVDETLDAPIVDSVLTPESTRQFPWDESRATAVAAGKLPAGPWQVTSRPRNRSKRSYFYFP